MIAFYYHLRTTCIMCALAACAMESYPASVKGAETNAPQQQYQSPAPQVPTRHQPIRNGHRLQPTQNELAKPDVSDGDATVVDELYRELIREERERYPDHFSRPASEPAAAAPTSSKEPR